MQLEAFLRNNIGYDIYKNNYRTEAIEKDAQKVGYLEARSFLANWGFNEKAEELRDEENKEEKIRKYSYDYRYDSTGKKILVKDLT